MENREFVTKEEVQKACKEMGLGDWSLRTGTEVSEEEARIIFERVRPGDMDIDIEEFRKGLEVELEHGTMFSDANVTNNHPVLTGKIVIAHFREMLDYYLRLEVAELEGDVFKALLAGNTEKVIRKRKALSQARLELARREVEQLKKAGR